MEWTSGTGRSGADGCTRSDGGRVTSCVGPSRSYGESGRLVFADEHLFPRNAGWNSMAVGEDQIVAQLKAAETGGRGRQEPRLRSSTSD